MSRRAEAMGARGWLVDQADAMGTRGFWMPLDEIEPDDFDKAQMKFLTDYPQSEIQFARAPDE